MVPTQTINILEKYFSDAAFAKVKSNDKKAYEAGWNKTNNYVYYDAELKKHLDSGGNYSFVTGFGDLLVVDFDDVDLNKRFMEVPLFRDTFRVLTANKRLNHCYFYINDPENAKSGNITKWDGTFVKDKDGNLTDRKNMVTLIDIQFEGRAAVGFGSKIGEKEYTIENEVTPKRIDFSEIVEQLGDLGDTNTLREEKKEKKTYNKDSETEDPIVAAIRKKFTVRDILKDCGIKITSKLNSECPFHTSNGGRCFSRTAEGHLWNCFDCRRSGDVFSLYQRLHKTTFPETLAILKKRVGITLEQDGGVSSQNAKEQLYYNLPLKSFIVYANHDETTYELVFENCRVWLDSSSLLTSHKFRIKYFNEVQEMLPSLSEPKWTKLINHWSKNFCKVVDNTESYNTNNSKKDILLDSIINSVGVTDGAMALNPNRFLYLKELPDYIFIANTSMQNIIDIRRLNLTLGDMHKLLKDYITGETRVINCGDYASKRFIPFEWKKLPNFEKAKVEELRNVD